VTTRKKYGAYPDALYWPDDPTTAVAFSVVNSSSLREYRAVWKGSIENYYISTQENKEEPLEERVPGAMQAFEHGWMLWLNPSDGTKKSLVLSAYGWHEFRD
jgi:hypothetical protein